MRPAQWQSQLNVWTPGLTVQNTGWFGIGDRIRLAVDVPDDLRHAGLDHAFQRDAVEGRGVSGLSQMRLLFSGVAIVMRTAPR
jgi:hypothetical protein